MNKKECSLKSVKNIQIIDLFFFLNANNEIIN